MKISDFSQKHSRFFFHGMPAFSPAQNSYFRSNELADKVDAIRALGGDISASTFINNTPHNGYDFGGAWQGVILADGEISHAATADVGTVMQADGTRTVVGNTLAPENFERNILQRSGTDPYNEIVVRNPVVGGLYVNLDPQGETAEIQARNNKPWESFNRMESTIAKLQHTAANSTGPTLPVYAIIKGQLREIHGFNVSHLDQYMLSSQGAEEAKNGEVFISSATDRNKLQQWKDFCKGKTSTEVFENALLLGPAMDPSDIHKRAQHLQLNDREKIQSLTGISHAWDDKFLPHLKQKIVSLSANSPNDPVQAHGQTLPVMSAARIAQQRNKTSSPSIAPNIRL